MIVISDLSVMPPLSRGKSIMVILKGYLDDSGDEIDPKRRVCAIAGFVATDDNWKRFEDGWPQILAEFGVPFLHMREFGNPTDDNMYRNLKKDAGRMVEFFKAINTFIQGCELRGFGSSVIVADLERFNSENGLGISAYSFALFGAMVEFFRIFPDVHAEMVIDHFSKVETHIEAAKSYIRNDNYCPANRDKLKKTLMIPLEEAFTFREILPIQAADFLAWEMRLSIHNKYGWFRDIKPTIGAEDWLMSLTMWRAIEGNLKKIELLAEQNEDRTMNYSKQPQLSATHGIILSFAACTRLGAAYGDLGFDR